MSRSHVSKAVEFIHTPSNVVPLGHCNAGVAAKHNRGSVTLPPGILESAGHWNSSIWVPLAPAGGVFVGLLDLLDLIGPGRYRGQL